MVDSSQNTPAITTLAGSINGRGPTRSNRRPVTGPSTPINSPPGSSISPTVSGCRCSACCRISGSMITVPNSAIMASAITIDADR